MKIEYNETKNQINIKDRGISFELANDFDFSSALIVEDTRKDYQESRFFSLGYITRRLYALVFTHRNESIRVISLRKANSREVKKYVKYQSEL